MQFRDRVSVGAVRRTADGYLVADARVARAGVQEYLGSEVGRPDMQRVRVYRPADEVFAADAMRSYAYRPVTVDHPSQMVDAETWKGVASGQTGGEVVRDGDTVRVPLVLMDAAAIKAWERGKRELSMGYTAEIVFGDGVTPDGQPYDAMQTQLRMNHLALVDKARAGSEFRIGDGCLPGEPETGTVNQSRKEKPMSNTRTVLVDGLSVETTDAGAQAITKLQGDLQASRQALSDANTAHTEAIAAKDADIAKRDAEIDALKAKVLTDAALDARVQARADLISTAKAIHDGDYAGKSDADIRKAVVVAKLGDSAIAGKSEAYIDARFDCLAEDAKRDPVTKVLRDGAANRQPVQDNGYAASVAAMDYRNRNQKEG